ncbi:MAG: DUF6049 family protein [Coriobacteriia bacterium]|nr:DUF6049 family protein [Coriobacteriia bacterium]
MPAVPGVAQPDTKRSSRAAALRVETVTSKLPGAVASLETTHPSIAAGGTFGYLVRTRVPRDATRVWVRFRVQRPTGRLIFQRTRSLEVTSPGSVETFFERTTDDLDLLPGVYPVEAEVVVSGDGAQRTASLKTGLRVYDEAKPRLTIALVTRISGQPLADPEGRFVADPARFTRSRDDAQGLAEWVLSEPTARVTLAISPLLLEEWSRITDGYEFIGPEGVETIPADSPVSKEYANALETLRGALGTGRLELTSLGYSDPALSDLEAAGLGADVFPQYEQGLSATFAALETTPSTGTVPANGCIPSSAITRLAQAGVRYAVVEADCTRTGESTAQPTSYQTQPGGLTVLVADSRLSSAITSEDTSAAVSAAFARAIDDDAFGPLTAVIELGPGDAEVAALSGFVRSMELAPWAGFRTARDAVRPTKRTVKLLAARSSDGAPADYWGVVAAARKSANALSSAAGEGAPDAVTAQRDSFIAQCSAWAGPDGRWAAADRGRAFAATAERLADAALGGVNLALEPITLAGAQGDVPITVRNAGDRTLAVTVRARASGGAHVLDSQVTTLALEPGESFLEIPIDLSHSVSGRLAVDILAGQLVLDSAEVTVRASYLDRIAVVGGVLVILGMMLAYIVRRVRIADVDADDADGVH